MGFIHSDMDGHPTLVSDLIEEWRPVIIDSMVMSLINGKEIGIDDFECSQVDQGCYLTQQGKKKVLMKYNNKLETTMSYVDGAGPMSYRRAMEYQVQTLIKTIELEDTFLYKPIVIR